MPEAQSKEIARSADVRSGDAPGATHDRLATIALLAAAIVLLTVGLSATDLWAPDEPRYAQVAEELRSMPGGAGDLVLLRLNGEPYTQKPPLYYWLAALAGAPAGRVTEWAARIPSALAGIAAVWLTLHFGQALFRSRAAGLWSAAILLTSFRFAHLARRAQLDVLLALFETVALFAFWRLEGGSRSVNPPRRHDVKSLALLHGALGCAVLTKGPVGLLPLAVMAGYLAWEGRLGRMKQVVPLWSLSLSIAPALAWLAGSLALAPDGFFQDAVVENLFGRFFSGTSHARPFYYYAYQFPADFMPWALLWPFACVCALGDLRSPNTPGGGANRVSGWRFVLAWLAVSLVFFSLSSGKRGLYLLPAFPAAAMACGAALASRLERPAALSRLVVTLGRALPLVLLLSGAVLAVAFGPQLELERLPGFPIPRSFGLALMAVGAASGFGLWWRPTGGALGASRPNPTASAHAASALVAVFGVELALFALIYPAFDAEKSPRPIAMALQQASDPGSPVAVFQHRSLIGGLSYYGTREVVDLTGVESVAPFLEAGGGAIAAGVGHRARLLAAAPLEIAGSLRAGRREVLILRAQSGTSGQISTQPDSEPADLPGDSR